MIPDKLVEIRRYAYKELADDDLRLLAEAGIRPYLKVIGRGEGTARLMVSEHEGDRARAILEKESAGLHQILDASPAKCTYCGSADVIALPPYALMVIGVAFAAAVIAAVYDRLAVSFAVLV